MGTRRLVITNGLLHEILHLPDDCKIVERRVRFADPLINHGINQGDTLADIMVRLSGGSANRHSYPLDVLLLTDTTEILIESPQFSEVPEATEIPTVVPVFQQKFVPLAYDVEFVRFI